MPDSARLDVAAGEACSPHWQAWTWQDSSDPLRLVAQTRAAITPGADEVIVRNAMIGLNPVDWKVLGGELVDWLPGKVPGVDGAGTVVAIGTAVPPAWLGARVAYHTSLATSGSFADHTPVMARALLRVPDALDFATAASMPCPALTASLAIEKVPARPGQRVLISGAGGSVGHYLVQLAAARGFDVTVMCHQRHAERLRALGAHAHVDGPLDAGDSWFARNAGRFYAVIDSVNAAHAATLAQTVRANGHVVAIQGRVEEWPCEPFGRAVSLHEVALGALHRYGDADDWAALTHAGSQLLEALADGRLQREAYVVGDFAHLPAHLDALRHRSFSGKPLVAVA